jgi:hypothetical protein
MNEVVEVRRNISEDGAQHQIFSSIGGVGERVDKMSHTRAGIVACAIPNRLPNQQLALAYDASHPLRTNGASR